MPEFKLSDFNDSQRRAILHKAGNLLIVAGPGTGKTHTLTGRILSQVPQLKPDQRILAITFTNKAGQEMRERLMYQMPDAQSVITIGTFHRFCLSLIREYFQDQFPRDFHVADPDDIERLIKKLWPEAKSRQRRGWLERISLWKARDFDQPPFKELEEYQSALRREGWLDFDDILLETVKQLQLREDILLALRLKYPLIFVDEFQDINPVQHQLLRMLVYPAGCLTAIGDPHQAIYGFRGSDVRFFDSFARDFPGAITLTLSENYRSAPNLLSASRQMMSAQSKLRLPAVTAHLFREGRLVIHEAVSDRAEAEYIVHQIERLVGGTSLFSRDSGRVDEDEGGKTFKDFAILFRLNSQKALLEEALNRSGIPYQVLQEKTYEDPEAAVVNAFKHAQDDNVDKVSLMTLHAAKGLEFAVVLIVGCEEGLLPLALEGYQADRDEERRLLYVGMTRAKENVFLVRAARRRLYGKVYETKPSPFLADIEEDLKEYEKPQMKSSKKDDGQLQLF